MGAEVPQGTKASFAFLTKPYPYVVPCVTASYDGWNSLQEMHYVYVLRCSDGNHYTGCTLDLEARLKRHAQGDVRYTQSRLPVEVIFYVAIQDKYKAFEFEKYLKSGSGRAFAKKHLL